MMTNKYIACCIFMYFLSFQAHSSCANIKVDHQRLECYDQLSKGGLELSDNADKSAAPNSETRAFNLTTMDSNEIVSYFKDRKIFQLTPHYPNYILPLSYNKKPNEDAFEEFAPGAELDRFEVKFQISGKFKLLDDIYRDNWDIWFGYTQRAWWQLYNSDESAPFRETNYAPEIFASYYSNVDIFGFKLVMTDIGLIHQSNGRSELLSRSWNRLYANFQLTSGDFLLSIQPWYRIPESDEDDDNPNIEDYMGYGNYRLTYKDEGTLYSLLLRNNLKFDDNKGGIELSWAFPVYDIVKLYLQYYNGYGESLIDYDHYVNRISLGILIYEWL
ncbi:hypothetical protein BIT28_14690 [Photobacterium proteolyticum]|uniref:Phospholipase A1 n=1 Tax=Photobacterium proteolyticum TaxID=1903952 RepID=A0A1Q9GVA7_9GAMM|nr:phospholipase A [Photobacterium proteolyticum]OLQ79079.1 hypothetical protein BIT28_14690 [Photobacterium proteolyticum]